MKTESQINWYIIILAIIGIAAGVMFVADKAQAFGYTDERAFQLRPAASWNEADGVTVIRPANIIADYSRVTCVITHKGMIVKTIVAKMKGREIRTESQGVDSLVFCQLAD